MNAHENTPITKQTTCMPIERGYTHFVISCSPITKCKLNQSIELEEQVCHVMNPLKIKSEFPVFVVNTQ